MEEAKRFLLGALGSGPRAQKELLADAERVGISGTTLRRAQKLLEIKPKALGKPGVKGVDHWIWKLPASDDGEGEHHDGVLAMTTFTDEEFFFS